MLVICPQCKRPTDKPASAVNRAQRIGAPIYCGKECAGLARRKNKTIAQKKAEKAAYDQRYRVLNIEELRRKKAERHRRTYDPFVERQIRKARRQEHLEYCRRPEYRAWKSDYDLRRRAQEYGPFADAYLLARDIDLEVKQRMTRYEIYQERGTLNKSTRRKRAAARGTVALG